MTIAGDILWRTRLKKDSIIEEYIEADKLQTDNKEEWQKLKDWALKATHKLNKKKGELRKHINIEFN